MTLRNSFRTLIRNTIAGLFKKWAKSDTLKILLCWPWPTRKVDAISKVLPFFLHFQFELHYRDCSVLPIIFCDSNIATFLLVYVHHLLFLDGLQSIID